MEFSQTQKSILPPPKHKPHPDLGIGPGVPHAGPYDAEMHNGVATAGYTATMTFPSAGISNGNGVYSVYMLVPTGNAKVGSSPDFSSGPIIPNSLFPIHFTGQGFRNGVVWDPPANFGDFDIPALNGALKPPFAVDGHSHIPIFTADSAEFAGELGTPLEGRYEYRVRMKDATGKGWDIVMPFTVTDHKGRTR